MPSHQLLLYFQNKLNIEESWRFNGSHYEQTSLAWLKKMDRNKKEIMSIFEDGFSEGMSQADALKLAARALYASGQRDAASGNGMDLAVITPASGYQQVSQEDIAKLLK